MPNLTGRKTGGRKAGVPNGKTARCKGAIEEVFVNLGGVAAMTEWAKENKDDFYKIIFPKLLPIQLRHSDGQGNKLQINAVTFPLLGPGDDAKDITPNSPEIPDG